MMRSSATPLQHLSAAAAAAAAKIPVTMSSGPPYRGGRSQGRRGFSSRHSYSSGRGQLFSGNSVRDGSLGFRQGERGSFGNDTGSYSYPHPQNPRPSFGENYQIRQAPPFVQRFPYRQHRPYTQNQQPQQLFRPQSPKPDYRNWEFARTRTPLPSNSDRFTVLSYNILADYLAMDHRRKLYYHIPLYMLNWEWRKRSIAFELGLWSADIMCFQEVDKFHDLEEALKVRGYSGIWKMRTGTAVDGCAIFWRISRFKLLHEEYIEFNKLGLRDNVAQICVLESQNNEDNSNAPPISSPSLRKVVICNIHVLYNPKRGEIKLGQVRVLLEKAQAVSKIWNNAPIVFCGDFNCTPKSALYNFISEQKLDLSGLDRDKVSGQASAEIHIPYLNSRAQPANDSIPFLSRSDVRDIDRKLDNSQSNMQNQDGPDSCAEDENLLLENHSLPPNTTDSVFSMSDKFCDNLQLQMKGITSHSELEKESQHGALHDHKNGRKTIGCFSQDSFKESSISCAEDESSIDHMSENVRELASSLTADSKEFYLVETDEKQMENVDTTCHLNHKSSTDDSDKKNENSFNIILDDAGIVQKSMEGTVKDSSIAVNFDHSDAEYEKESSAREIKGVPSCSSTIIDLAVDENLEILSSNEQDIATVDGSLTEDDCTFLSALHDGEDPSPSELGQSVSHLEGFDQSKDDHLPVLNADSYEIENITFDRSIWTPMDIETATGNPDCTLMEHPLKLISTYTEVEDFSRTRDLNGEPLVTSYNRCFMGTVDYIWRSEGLQTVRVLAPIQKHAMQWTPGFPTKKWGSDHIALVTELAFIQRMRNDESES